MTLGELIGDEFSDYANIERWIKTIKAKPSWSTVNEVHNSFAASMQGKPFVTLA